MRIDALPSSRLLALAVVAAGVFPVGCSLLAGDTEVVPGNGGQGGGKQVGGVAVDPVTSSVVCDPASYPGATVEAALAAYVANVHPLFLDQNGVGCIACHGATSSRQFKVLASAEETFHNARTGGFFDNKPAGVLGKILNGDPKARMP